MARQPQAEDEWNFSDPRTPFCGLKTPLCGTQIHTDSFGTRSTCMRNRKGIGSVSWHRCRCSSIRPCCHSSAARLAMFFCRTSRPLWTQAEHLQLLLHRPRLADCHAAAAEAQQKEGDCRAGFAGENRLSENCHCFEISLPCSFSCCFQWTFNSCFVSMLSRW